MYRTKYLIDCKCGDNHRILINCLTGAIDLIGENQFQRLITDKGINTIKPEVFMQLKERGYVFNSIEEETEILDRIRKMYFNGVSQDRYTFWICPTYACNMRCNYCFEGNCRSMKEVMDRAQIDAAFVAMESLNDSYKDPLIHIYGGEPLLPETKKAVSLILERAVDKKYFINILTNGTYIIPFLPLLKKYRNKLNNVQITLDGIEEVHNENRIYANKKGTFKRIVNGIDNLLEAEIPVQVRTNLSPYGLEKFPDFVNFVIAKGWAQNSKFSCHFTTINNRHCGENVDYLSEMDGVKAIIRIRDEMPSAEFFEDFDIIHMLDILMIGLGYGGERKLFPKFHFCNANRKKSYLFGPDNSVYLCPSAAGDPKLAVGNFFPNLELNEERLSLWAYNSAENLLRCKDCPAILLCGGGCAFKSLKLQSNDTICNVPILMKDFVNNYQELILKKLA